MPEFDVAQFKRALSAVKETRRDYSELLREANISEGSQRRKNRQAIGQFLKPFLTKAGLDVEKLDKLLAQNQTESRGALSPLVGRITNTGFFPPLPVLEFLTAPPTNA